MAIKANNDIQGNLYIYKGLFLILFKVSRVELQSSPSVAAAAIAVGAAVVLLLTALAVVTGKFYLICSKVVRPVSFINN